MMACRSTRRALDVPDGSPLSESLRARGAKADTRVRKPGSMRRRGQLIVAGPGIPAQPTQDRRSPKPPSNHPAATARSCCVPFRIQLGVPARGQWRETKSARDASTKKVRRSAKKCAKWCKRTTGPLSSSGKKCALSGSTPMPASSCSRWRHLRQRGGRTGSEAFSRGRQCGDLVDMYARPRGSRSACHRFGFCEPVRNTPATSRIACSQIEFEARCDGGLGPIGATYDKGVRMLHGRPNNPLTRVLELSALHFNRKCLTRISLHAKLSG